jgi:hypothetical protein
MGLLLRTSLWAAAAAAALAGAAPVQAGPYSDELAKCLVRKTSDADKALLIRWMFVAMSASPAVREVVATSPQLRHDYALKGGGLFQRLLTEDCRAETVAALKYEGNKAVETSFEVLGQVAMRSLLGDSAVQREMTAMATSFDQPKFEALLRDAGLPPAAPK